MVSRFSIALCLPPIHVITVISCEITLNLNTAMDISCLPRPYLPSKRGQTGSLSAGSWSFSQHQFLAASCLGPLLQLLFSWFAEIPVVLM